MMSSIYEKIASQEVTPINKMAREINSGFTFEMSMPEQQGKIVRDSPIPYFTECVNGVHYGPELKGYLKQFIGLKFGKLTVLGKAKQYPRGWVVSCECGRFTLRQLKSIRKANDSAECEWCSRLKILAKRGDFNKKLEESQSIPQPQENEQGAVI